MIRNALLGIVLLAIGAGLAGCGQADTGRNDMPFKVSQRVDPKTGKALKTFGASLEDPPGKK
jgi:hypothetical protein